MSDANLPGDDTLVPEEERTPIDANLSPSADRLLEELKHSIRTHLVIMQGPSPQLTVFLVKLIDFLEDKDDTRRKSEMAKLAFAIVESVALFVQQSIDQRATQAAAKGDQFPASIQNKGDNLLVVIGKARQLPDKIAAKSALLKEIAEALRSLSTYTKARYPDMTDVMGNIL
jgi:hypothetical protein